MLSLFFQPNSIAATQIQNVGNSTTFVVSEGKNSSHQYHQHSRTLPRIDHSNGDNRRFSTHLVNGSQTNEATTKIPTTQNHTMERSLDHQTTSIPPLPPTRTAHIHSVNIRQKSLSFGPVILPPKMDTFNSNHVGRAMNGSSDVEGGNSSSSSPPTSDSISQKASKIVAATATMPRNLNGSAASGMNGRKKKSVTIGTFTTVETFDPSSYDPVAAAAV